MTVDFEALAAGIASTLPDVRACVVLSAEGLVLGGHPPAAVEAVTDIWGRLAGLGEVARGFVTVRDQTWVFARRGPYASVAVVGPAGLPGLVLDRLERLLLAAEESRTRREVASSGPWREPPRVETPRAEQPRTDPTRRAPRSLHPEGRPAAADVSVPEVVTVGVEPVAAAASQSAHAESETHDPVQDANAVGGQRAGRGPRRGPCARAVDGRRRSRAPSASSSRSRTSRSTRSPWPASSRACSARRRRSNEQRGEGGLDGHAGRTGGKRPKRTKQLGEILVERGLILQEDLDRALQRRAQTGQLLGRILIDMNLIRGVRPGGRPGRADRPGASSSSRTRRSTPTVAALIPEQLARRYRALPIGYRDDRLVVAMADPSNLFAVDDIRTITGLEVQPVVATAADIEQAIRKYSPVRRVGPAGRGRGLAGRRRAGDRARQAARPPSRTRPSSGW